MKTKNKIYRQGDVLIIPTKQIPKNLVKTNKVTLALGEVTGHHHSITDSGCVGYATAETELAQFIEVTADSCDLTHQEHDTVAIPEGTYQVIKQVEYTPKELVNVRD
jgi:hypothetical protein